MADHIKARSSADKTPSRQQSEAVNRPSRSLKNSPVPGGCGTEGTCQPSTIEPPQNSRTPGRNSPVWA